MAREAANMGIKKIWINLNYDSPNFTEISKRNGLSIIGGECFYQWNNQVQKAKRFRNFFLSVFA
jgi:predicted CoA-binding protein